MRNWWIVVAVLALLLAACDNRVGSGDSGVVDAADGSGDDGGDLGADEGGDQGGDLGADRPVMPWTVGSEDTLELASWNIQNFPGDQGTAGRVAQLIEEMDLDLVAVQEITDVDAFESMVDQLPRHWHVLSDDEYGSGEYQKTGFVYRSDFIRLRSTLSIFQADGYAFPRPPMQAEFIINRPDGSSWTLFAIVLHLKASLGEDNEARRRDACEKLKGHVDNLLAGGSVDQVVLLGDFNDSLNDSANDNVFTAFTDEPATYRFATQALADAYEYSYIPARVLIDHVLVTSGLFDDVQAGTTQVMELDYLIDDYSYMNSVSDHRPVVTIWPR